MTQTAVSFSTLDSVHDMQDNSHGQLLRAVVSFQGYLELRDMQALFLPIFFLLQWAHKTELVEIGTNEN